MENLLAIGEYPSISLQEARKTRDKARDLVKQAFIPRTPGRKSLAKQLAKNVNTFESVVREWLGKKNGRWAPYSHKQANTCLERNAFPKIGRLPIRSVTASHIVQILQDMEKRGAET
ncbi:tyrosine-type recombinase/integrase [Nitrospira sp. Nam74]